MALFDRNNDRGWRGMDDHLRRDYENRSTMDTGGYRGMDRGGHGREGLWNNSWSDGAWTADAADRTDRDWNLGGGRYDRDMRPTEAGWRAGSTSMNRGGMGMSRGGMDRDHGWNLAGGDWGHNWGSGNLGSGYGAGGMDRDRDWNDRGGMNRGGGFMDRAQNALRRGWEQVEDRFDRDDDRHLGGGAMRGGTSWAGNYDREYGMRGDTPMRGDSGVRGYRDDEGHYGVIPAPTDMNRGYGGMSGGMNRYGTDYDRGGMMGRGRYDNQYRGGRNWF
jgi:hypothetical protein